MTATDNHRRRDDNENKNKTLQPPSISKLFSIPCFLPCTTIPFWGGSGASPFHQCSINEIPSSSYSQPLHPFNVPFGRSDIISPNRLHSCSEMGEREREMRVPSRKSAIIYAALFSCILKLCRSLSRRDVVCLWEGFFLIVTVVTVTTAKLSGR